MQTLNVRAKMLTLMAPALILAGCSNGLNQDPYANQPDEVRNAGPLTPIEKDKKAGDALSSDYLQIEAPDTASFVEGKDTAPLKIKGGVLADVNGHVAIPGQDYELSITNLADFPGASWDAVAGEFKWTPQPGFVTDAYTRNIHIDVMITAKFGPYKRALTIPGIVTRTEMDPTIESVEDLTMNPVKEGEVREFKVVVRDPHADGKSANGKPRLQVISDGSGATSAANLIYCAGYKGCSDPTVDPNDAQLFTFKLRVDLQGKEITTNRSTLAFGLMATSRFGEASAIKKSNVVIVTTLQDPVTSWSQTDPIQVVAGRENNVTFTVYDSTTEGQLSVNFDSRCDLVLGNSATCTCTNLQRSGSSAQLCTIFWSVPARTLQTDFNLSFTAHNQTRDGSQVKNTQYARTLHVVQPASGSPQPGPTPTPPIHTQSPRHRAGGQS